MTESRNFSAGSTNVGYLNHTPVNKCKCNKVVDTTSGESSTAHVVLHASTTSSDCYNCTVILNNYTHIRIQYSTALIWKTVQRMINNGAGNETTLPMHSCDT
jgi:hypothetical protein